MLFSYSFFLMNINMSNQFVYFIKMLYVWVADQYLLHVFYFFSTFLHDLQHANCDPTLVANAFLQNDSGFSIYTLYCTHYPRTMMVLTELTRDEKMAALFRERQTALGHALPLGSYLLKPVQRILKYHLLLQVRFSMFF